MGRTLLCIGLFLIWSVISWQWYTCGIKGHCVFFSDASSEVQSASAPKYGALSFKTNTADAVIDNRWSQFRDSVLAEAKEGQALIISGPYWSDESAPTGFDNMGLARAAKVKDLLSDSVDVFIELAAHLKDDIDEKNGQFDGALFKWVTRNENVQATLGGALIYFPYKSDQKISNQNIITYLDDLALELRKSERTVDIIGHTDDKGSEAYNEKLGMERAMSIKAELVSRGVPVSKIKASSAGETQPVESNETEAGKEKNRRTEIKLN
jgi:outer membrane protein OmpA-like peptidoglycan-associated protein